MISTKRALALLLSLILSHTASYSKDGSVTNPKQSLDAALREYREYLVASPPKTGRFESDIQKVLAADRANPPGHGRILFIGSSVFRRWTNVVEQMAPLPVFNRAFGGSRTSDILERLDQLVLPYEPKVIVYYAGSNDINAKAPAAAAFGGFYDFEQRVHAKLPETRILYVAIDSSPQKQEKGYAEVVSAANALVREYCSTNPKLTFIDASSATHDAEGHARVELYCEDKLHPLPATYDGFAAIIKPVLEKVWAEVNAAKLSP